MDNTADNPDAYREEGLLGDWENKYLVAYLAFPERSPDRPPVHDFRGTKLTAVTSMKGVSEIKDSRHKNLV
eukprot:jgi/Tetstr1/458779/TSEL_045163.t1